MSAKRDFSILQACADRNLFGLWFRDRQTWTAWFVFLAALFALPMDEEQLAVYRKHTGRQEPPATPQNEAWLICGRRGGKSLTMALTATYLACFREYRQYLQQGERATIAVIAADRKQARVILRYCACVAHADTDPQGEDCARETAEAFDLTGRVTIEVTTASQRSTRGYTYAAVLCDEIAFWRTDDDAADPDYAILDAIRPGLATIPGALLLCASSPYARKGSLWDSYQRWFGPKASQDSPLVWRATTREMNPTVPQRLIDEAMERDPASARAEYLAEFRADLEALLTREAVRACVVSRLSGTARRPPGIATLPLSIRAVAVSDSMTLAIAHKEKARRTTGSQQGSNRIRQDDDDNWLIVLDAVRERVPPFSPENGCARICHVNPQLWVPFRERRSLRGPLATREVQAPRHDLRSCRADTVAICI